MAVFDQLRLGRREWIRRIVVASGAAALGPSLALADDAVAKWTPQTLTPQENEILINLGDILIPGSKEALCNRIIDLVLGQEDAIMHQQLGNALASFDHEAQSRFQQPFTASTTDRQNSILAAASENKSELHAQFSIVKEWMADAYWSSEKGLRELGWTGRMAWDSFPDCEHPAPHN